MKELMPIGSPVLLQTTCGDMSYGVVTGNSAIRLDGEQFSRAYPTTVSDNAYATLLHGPLVQWGIDYRGNRVCT